MKYIKKFEGNKIRWYKDGKLELPKEYDIIDVPEKDVIYCEEFTKFLIDNNAYDNYFDAIISRIVSIGDTRSKIERINSIINNRTTRIEEFMDDTIIDRTLSWDSTKQGHSYWANINKLWKDCVRLHK